MAAGERIRRQARKQCLRSTFSSVTLVGDDRPAALPGPDDQRGRCKLHPRADRAASRSEPAQAVGEAVRSLAVAAGRGPRRQVFVAGVEANGALRDMVCRGLLLMLHRSGAIELAAVRQIFPNPLARRDLPPPRGRPAALLHPTAHQPAPHAHPGPRPVAPRPVEVAPRHDDGRTRRTLTLGFVERSPIEFDDRRRSRGNAQEPDRGFITHSVAMYRSELNCRSCRMLLNDRKGFLGSMAVQNSEDIGVLPQNLWMDERQRSRSP